MKGIRIMEVRKDGVIIPLSHAVSDTFKENFYTVIIGNNAAGKSRLLVNILNSLRTASNQRLKQKDDQAELDLIFNGKRYNVSDDKIGLFQEFNENVNLISISNSLFDKFPHQVKSDKNYSYVGVRINSINTHRRAIVNDLMDIFSNNLADKTFVNKARELFEFLNIKPVIKIALKVSFASSTVRFESLLENNKSVKSLKGYLMNISQEGFYRQQSTILENYANNPSFINKFHTYLKNHLLLFRNNPRDENIFHEIHLDNQGKNESFINEYEFFSLLRRLNILTYEYIRLKKSGIEYDILDSSTGEIGLLITFLRAIPQMKSNSIVFIDEPEISLHPSWQMKYIELLRNFLQGYSGCHILIATHSHFLLSDLKEEWSSVVVLQNNNGVIKAEIKDHTPYGWSPEAILYEVFGVATVRNHYFEYDLKKMLALLSNRSKNLKEIQKYIDWFKQYNYEDGDPLQLIIKEAENYVSST